MQLAVNLTELCIDVKRLEVQILLLKLLGCLMSDIPAFKSRGYPLRTVLEVGVDHERWALGSARIQNACVVMQRMMLVDGRLH